MPVIGFLHAGSPSPVAPYLAEFRRALAETSYVENQNVAIEYRYADGQCDRLPKLAGDLIRRRVTVVVTAPSANAARAVGRPRWRGRPHRTALRVWQRWLAANDCAPVDRHG